jgi:hypothetical protein
LARRPDVDERHEQTAKRRDGAQLHLMSGRESREREEGS